MITKTNNKLSYRNIYQISFVKGYIVTYFNKTARQIFAIYNYYYDKLMVDDEDDAGLVIYIDDKYYKVDHFDIKKNLVFKGEQI